MDLQIRFCASADGTRIAYATLGAGPPVVSVSGWGTSMESCSRSALKGVAYGSV